MIYKNLKIIYQKSYITHLKINNILASKNINHTMAGHPNQHPVERGGPIRKQPSQIIVGSGNSDRPETGRGLRQKNVEIYRVLCLIIY